MKYTGEILAAVCAENGMQASLTETGTPQKDNLRKNIFALFTFTFFSIECRRKGKCAQMNWEPW